MPLRIVTTSFTDPIFNRAAREGVISRGLTRKAKRYKKKVVDTMVQTPATGRVYAKGNATGFTRAHRASSKGNPPAVDTGNLIRSVEDHKTSPTTHEVYVDDPKAPYGKYLERPRLDRPIMGDLLTRRFEATEGREEDLRMLRELGGTV